MLTSSYAGHSKYADRDGEPRYSAGAPFNYDDKSTEPLPPHGVFEFDYVSTNTAHREALEAPLPSQVFRALELDLCTVWSRVVNTNVKKPKGLGIAGAASKTPCPSRCRHSNVLVLRCCLSNLPPSWAPAESSVNLRS